MLEEILKYERELFFLINGSDSTLLDHFMWLVSDKLVWIPWIVCLLCLLFYKKNWKEALHIVFAIAVVITICDQVASGLFKPLFHRFRPTHHPDFAEEVKVLFGYRGGRYGFASSHAANAFGVAAFTALLFKNKFFTFSIFIFAVLNAYSRIYLGVHFISDIAAGLLIGLFAGLLCYYLYLVTRKHLLKIPGDQLRVSLYPSKDVCLIAGGFWITLLVLLIFNNQLVILLT